MKFALVTADRAHKKQFHINPESGDGTSFMQWVSIFGGLHLSFEALREEGDEILKYFDVVMMSGNPSFVSDIIRIGKYLKDTNTITMFYPEGSAQLYDSAITNFHPEYFEAWRACDILSIAEEDKQSYYEALVTHETLVRFIHVPMTLEMSGSLFYIPREKKEDLIAVYGDNNPNHPVIAFAAIDRLCTREGKQFSAVGVETRDAEIGRLFPDLQVSQMGKQALNPFLRLLGRTMLSFYPTEWIGTARHQISCAVVGTPCIGSRESHTQQFLFPKLATGIYEVDKMVELAHQLLADTKFYKEVIAYARQRLRHYDMGNTLRRFNDAVSDAREKFKNRVAAS